MGNYEMKWYAAGAAVIGCWILSIVCIFSIYALYRYRSEPFYHTRYGALSVWGAISLLLYTIIHRPIAYTTVGLRYNTANDMSPYDTISESCQVVVWTIAINVWMACVLIRVYMVDYDIRWTNASFETSWKSIIDPITYQPVNNYYLRNKSRLGNRRFITKLFCFLILGILAPFQCIVRQFGLYGFMDMDTNVAIFSLTPLALSVIPMIYAWRIPPFTDLYFIRTEVKIIGIVTFIGMIILLISMSAVKMVVSNEFWIPFIIEPLGMGATVSCILFTTRYVLYKNARGCCPSLQMGDVRSDVETESHRSTVEPLTVNKIKHTNIGLLCGGQSQLNEEMSIKNVFINDRMLDLLVRHLAAEYSMEILFSIIEMSQLQQFIIDTDGISDNEYLPPLTFNDELRFSDNVPKSILVYRPQPYIDGVISGFGLGDETPLDEGTKQLIGFRIRAYDIYNKYIRVGSEYEINISYLQRVAADKYLSDRRQWICGTNDGNKTAVDICRLFDDSMIEMLFLLSDSFRSFRRVTNVKNFLAESNAAIETSLRPPQ